MKKVILTGGGTAGHVMPNLALIPFLDGAEVHYIGSGGMEKEIMKGKVIYHEISSTKLIRSFNLKNLTIPFRLIKAVLEAKKIIKEVQPSVIFSKGGYVSLPVALASQKTPVILHESDMSLGLANRLALKKCNKLLTSFDKIKHDKADCVGAPLRQSIYSGSREKALKASGLTANGKPFLLIFGGSLGAKAINEAVWNNLDVLLEGFNVVHVVGKGNKSDIKRRGYFETEFILDMHDFFALADYAVSRGGANSLFELIALNIPTLCIPLGRAESRGDQLENAQYFKQKGCISVLNEQDIDSLPKYLKELRENSVELKTAMRKAQNIDGTRKIAGIINSFLV